MTLAAYAAARDAATATLLAGRTCPVCGEPTGSGARRYCPKHRNRRARARIRTCNWCDTVLTQPGGYCSDECRKRGTALRDKQRTWRRHQRTRNVA